MVKTLPVKDDPRIARTRQYALDAALELIAESGVQGSTFDTVSQRSGVSRSTLYRHWNNKSELLVDAFKSQVVERVAPDTGNLRDDMLTAMLELGQALQNTTWGTMVAQLMAVAAIDPEVAKIQQETSDYHIAIDSSIIKRAIKRGEIAEHIDPEHIAVLFSAPIFYQHLFTTEGASANWITTHIDQTIALLTSR